jgi:hypothetical protein
MPGSAGDWMRPSEHSVRGMSPIGMAVSSDRVGDLESAAILSLITNRDRHRRTLAIR